MTKYTFMACVLAAGAVALSSCSEDAPSRITRGHGTLVANVAMDGTIKSPRQSRAPQSRADVPDASQLSLRLVSTDGTSFSKEWASLAEFSTDEQFEVGNYTLEAWYGTEGAEGFDCPYFYGSCPVKIEDRKTTTVALTAALGQALVDVNYTDAFKHFMTAYSAKVNGHALVADDARAVYVVPGTVSVTVDFTKPNGDKGANYEVARFEAKAQTHYHVTVDLDGGAGDAKLVVSYDDELDTQEVIIDISDLVMNAPAPVAEGSGFTSGQTVEFVSGMAPGESLKVNMIAQGGLKEVNLTTSGSSLLAQGWPAEINLLAATADQQAAMRALGFDVLGLWNNPDKMAVVDFTGVLAHIAYLDGGNNTTSFSISVKDANYKVAEPVVLTVDCQQLVLEITGGAALQPDTPASITLAYNGSDPAANVKFFAANNRGTYDPINDVVFSDPVSRAVADYTVTFPSLPTENAVAVKAVCNGVESNIYTLRPAPFEVAVNSNDVYARHAFVTVNGTEGENRDQATLAAAAKYYISADGQNFSEVTGAVDGVYTHIADIEPASTYYIKVKIDGLTSKVTTFTTEEALPLPNPGMEDWCKTDGASNWELVYPCVSMENCSWGTNNPLTASQGGNFAYCRVSGTVSADGASGKCALIRTVGWGSGNSAVSSDGSKGTTKYIDAGLLHLGASRTIRPDGYKDRTGTISTDDLECGIAFASRPTQLSFKYKYTAKNPADNGMVEFWVKDAEGNTIASGTKNLAATSAWVTVPLDMVTPAVGTAKAAKVYVKFLSTNSESFLTKTKENLTGPGFIGAGPNSHFLGSQLYIDDITLNY